MIPSPSRFAGFARSGTGSNPTPEAQAGASAPEVRPDVIARGTQLAADKTYPSKPIVERVAALIIAAPEPTDDT